MLFRLAFLISFTAIAAAAEPPETIKIGVIQSLTGIAAEYGNNVVRSLQLAQEDLNASGDTNVELIIEDDQTQPKSTVAAFHRLAAAGVDAIIGASWDFTTNSIVPLAAQYKLVTMNSSSLREAVHLDQGQGYAFANGFLIGDEIAPFIQFVSLLSKPRVAIIYANNAWGEAQHDAYRKIVVDRGLEVVDEYKPTDYDANDWGGLVPRIKAKNPDLTILLINKNDLEILLRKFKELRFEPAIYVSVNGYDAVRTSSDKAPFEGICFPYPREQLDRSAEFLRRFQNKFNAEPLIYADSTYDALGLIVTAVKSARKEGIELKAALQKTEYKGMVGTFRFDPVKSFSLGRSSLMCVENGVAKVRH